MVIKWFDASKAEEFGKTLAQFFIERIPRPSSDGKKVPLDKQFATVDKLYLKVDQFKLDNKLNIYQKAKMANAFKFELLTAGYDPKLVDQLTSGLLLKF
jgi:hypothetical protein